MKKSILFKSLLLAAVFMLPQLACAYDFMVNGLCYNKNSGGTSVTVTYQNTSSPRYTDLVGDLIIPKTVTFSGKTYSVTEIGDFAFDGCNGLTGELTIPNTVTNIGAYAFRNCNGIVSLSVPSSLTSMGTQPFSGCSDMEVITVEDENPIYDSRNNCNAIVETATNTLVKGCKTTIIPNTVTSIGNYAFMAGSLTSINIPNSVTTIGTLAFFACYNLAAVAIPNSVTSIGERAFFYCKGLKNVTIGESVTNIDSQAFYYCTGLTSVHIGESVTSIGSQAFFGCSALTSVYISDLSAWCNIAFVDANSNPLFYAQHLFLNDAEVKDLFIPNSVTSIGNYAFYRCSGLTSVTIPSSVSSIGNYALSCSNLSAINSLIEDPLAVTLGTTVFSAVNKNTCQLMVPAGTVEAYRAADQWKDFLNIKVDASGFELTAEPSITTTAHQATPIVFSVMNPVDIKGIEFDIATSTWLNATGTIIVKTGAAEPSIVDIVSQPVFTLTERFIGDEMDETKWMYLFGQTDLIEYPNMLNGAETEKGLYGTVAIHMGEEVQTEEGIVVKEYLEAGEGELFAINLYPLISGDHIINISNVKLTLVDGTVVELDPFTINVKANRVPGDLNDDGVVDENDVPGGAKKYYNLAIDAGNIVTGEINKETLMPISLHNTGDVTAFSCTISLPEHIQMVDDINSFVVAGDRGENVTFTAIQNQNGTITINGTTATPLEAGEGAVLNLKVTSTWQNTYSIPVTNMTITTASGTVEQLPDSETKLVMQGTRGDMNGDGRVDLSDALYIINLATGLAE